MKNLHRGGAEDAESLLLSFFSALCSSAVKAFLSAIYRVNSYEETIVD
jgi:hypothetical protein